MAWSQNERTSASTQGGRGGTVDVREDLRRSGRWKKRAYRRRRQVQAKCTRARSRIPNNFWGEQAKRIDWIKPYTKVKNTSFAPGNVSIKWFEDGSSTSPTTASTGISTKRGDQTAIIWEGDDPHGRHEASPISELHDEVCRFANVLKARGVKKGDRVTIYLPMIPEAAYRDARLRAHRRDPFGGVRRLLAEVARRPHRGLPVASVVITADEGLRGGKQGAAQGQRRRGARRSAGERRARASSSRAPAATVDMDAGPRRLVPRGSCQGRPTDCPSRARWTPRTRCSSSTPRAPPASPRACCTPPAAICCLRRDDASSTSSTITTATSTGAPPTSAGSPATATSSTARSPTARPR